MTDAATVEKLSEVRSRIYDDNRVSLSDFARGKEWRSKLANDEFMELQDHGERMAWIISEDGMRGVIDYISELEERVEQESTRAMFSEREGNENWESGEQLKRDALKYFGEHKADLSKAASLD